MREFSRVWDSLPSEGWLSLPEALLLWTAAESVNGAVLEVGCYQGRSTILLATRASTVYSVDLMDGFHSDLTGDQIEERFWENLRTRHVGNVVLTRKRIEDWASRPQVELAYLDGDHTYQGTVNQIQIALECGAPIIAIHDVNDIGEGTAVKMAAIELLGPWRYRVERLAVWEREK